ncbi:MAG: hypothetical protein P4L99_04960 [Chthoniobacter sp.]|nr:hypothetical protein [Chthoniobacter sp.]
MKSHPLSSPATLRATPQPPPAPESGASEAAEILSFDPGTPYESGGLSAEETCEVRDAFTQMARAYSAVSDWALAMHDALMESGADFSKIVPLGKEVTRVSEPAMQAAKRVTPILGKSHGE